MAATIEALALEFKQKADSYEGLDIRRLAYRIGQQSLIGAESIAPARDALLTFLIHEKDQLTDEQQAAVLTILAELKLEQQSIRIPRSDKHVLLSIEYLTQNLLQPGLLHRIGVPKERAATFTIQITETEILITEQKCTTPVQQLALESSAEENE